MILLIPLFIYTLLIFPYLNTIPYLDGNTEFKVAYNFFSGNYFVNWIPYHPPLKPILASILFYFFGASAYTYLGFLLGFLGIVSIYSIAESLFDKKTAILSALFLSISGLYVSTSLFSLNDFIMTVFILIAFAFYLKKQYVLYAIAISLAVCSKETAILFPLCVTITELLKKQFHWVQIVPGVALIGWIVFLYTTGHGLWNSWNFSDQSNKGIHVTIMQNIFELKLFNKFAFENWLHLFVFNYMWAFWLVLLIGIRHIYKQHHIRTILLFFVLYTLLVLTIQTYTITRYILPLIPFIYILTARTVVHSRFAPVFVMFLILFSISALFSSSDPVSDMIWSKTVRMNTAFYSRPLDGNDGITYNMQFLRIVKNRSVTIRDGSYTTNSSLGIDQATLAAYKVQ